MKIHVYYDKSHYNLGDLLENPTLYWQFPNAEVIEHNIYEKDTPEHTKDDLFIFGGGGLIHPSILNAIGEKMINIRAKTVFIGGHNFHDFSALDKYPDTLTFFSLVGLRDYTETSLGISKYCPALSCMHPIFDNIEISDNGEAYIYNHKDHRINDIDDSNMASFKNYEETFKDIITKMAQCKVVITSSYHGYLWATYLKKSVIVIPYSTKFLMTRYPPKIANDLKQAMDMVQYADKFTIYKRSLETDRLACQKYRDSIDNLINNEMTVAYDICSKNIGDNLVWFTEIVNHCNLLNPKAVHCKSTLSKLLSEIHPEIDFTRPTSETWDRIYKLGVNMCPNWRTKSMNGMAQTMLGIKSPEYHMDLRPLVLHKPLPDKYITYNSHSSWKWKSWQYPNGWEILKKMVKEKYDMEMIDCSLESNQIPSDLRNGAITYIGHSELFIGSGSGLSWVAYYLFKKQVLLSGMSQSGSEMDESSEYTKENVRILRPLESYTGCKNCYNYVEPFPATHKCCLDKNYECNSTLTPARVMVAISELLGH